MVLIIEHGHRASWTEVLKISVSKFAETPMRESYPRGEYEVMEVR